MNESSVLFSSFYDKRFSYNNLLTTYELEYEDGEIEQRLDFADWRFASLIRRIKRFTTMKYNGVEKFTTISYRYYGTTSAYRIILAFNGFMHPYEVGAGTVIKIPSFGEIQALIEKMDKSKQPAGRVITF